MRITRTSPFTGRENTLDIPVTEAQLKAWKDGKMIQDAMSNLSADQREREREFMMTGILAVEWDDMVGGR